MPPPRAPLSTLSLTPYISLNTRRSPQKSRMASPLRTSSSSRRSTTPRHATAGPLGTLYEAPPLAPSILAVQASPARRMLEADEREVDEEDGLGATPPRRLLDMFLQSATKPVNGSSERSSRSSSPAFGGASASLTVEREELPAWTFYEDIEDASFDPPPVASSSTGQATQEDTDMDSPDTTPPTNENEPPAPLPRRSRSTNSLAAPPSNIPSPLSPRRARSASANPNPLPVPPPTITIPPPTSTRPTAAAAEDEPPSTPPLFFPSWTETTSAPALSPSLSSTSFFGDGAVSSFDTQAQTSSALLPGFVAVFSSPRRAGVKRESLVEVVDAQQEEEKEEEEQGHEQKRLRMSVGEE